MGFFVHLPLSNPGPKSSGSCSPQTPRKSPILFPEWGFFCDPAGIRTQDPYIKSVLLYQLSYRIGTLHLGRAFPSLVVQKYYGLLDYTTPTLKKVSSSFRAKLFLPLNLPASLQLGCKSNCQKKITNQYGGGTRRLTAGRFVVLGGAI